ncbi:hypothetical protein ONZ45_g1604 [Pleurotus djamor]|nr:hypothetical protein ONZ45_g1604 [Pleurotus djamor]
MPLLGGLSSADIRRFNRAAVRTVSTYLSIFPRCPSDAKLRGQLDPEQEKRLLVEMEATLTSIAEVLHPEGSTPDDLETLPSDIQSLKEEITIYKCEVDATRRRIAELAQQLNEVHPLLEEKLLHALDVIPGTVHKQQTAEANLQAATIELGLMKLAYLRSRVSQAIYGVMSSGETGSGSTMSEALERANAKLKADARRMDEEERELESQLAAYEQTLALVDGSGGFSQVIEDWIVRNRPAQRWSSPSSAAPANASISSMSYRVLIQMPPKGKRRRATSSVRIYPTAMLASLGSFGARPLSSLPDASFEAWLCSTCNTMNKQQQHSNSNASTPSMPKPLYPDAGMQHNQWPMNNSMTALYNDAFMSSMVPPIQLGGDALPKSPAPFKGLQSSNDHQDISRHSDHSSSLPSSLQSTPPLVHSTPSIPPPSFTCMWGDCLATFQHLSELVGHVNLQHLRLPSNSAPDTSVHTNESLPRLPFFDNRSPPSPSSSQLQPSPVPPGHDPNNIFCLWRNCHVAPTPNTTPGPSSGNVSDSFAEALAAHLWHDHLGLTTPLPNGLPNTLPQPNPPLPSLWDSNAQPTKPRSDEPSPPESDSGPETEDTSHGHDCSVEVHRCLWQSCDQTFDTCDDLTNHLTSVHVGGGKGQYECRWNGCDRHGDRSFTSKQKICRHLQTHTGHRPFKCQICNERFSEAATLQQHIRRHTNEKGGWPMTEEVRMIRQIRFRPSLEVIYIQVQRFTRCYTSVLQSKAVDMVVCLQFPWDGVSVISYNALLALPGNSTRSGMGYVTRLLSPYPRVPIDIPYAADQLCHIKDRPSSDPSLSSFQTTTIITITPFQNNMVYSLSHFKRSTPVCAGAPTPATRVLSDDLSASSSVTTKIGQAAVDAKEPVSFPMKSKLSRSLSRLIPSKVDTCASEDTVKGISLSKVDSQETLRSFSMSDSSDPSASSSIVKKKLTSRISDIFAARFRSSSSALQVPGQAEGEGGRIEFATFEDFDDDYSDYPAPRGPFEYHPVFGASLYPPTPPLDTPFQASYTEGFRSTLNFDIPISIPLSLPSPSLALTRLPSEYTNGTIIFLHDETPFTPAIHIHPPSSKALRSQLRAVFRDIEGGWETTLPDAWMSKKGAPVENLSLLTAYKLNEAYAYPDPRVEKKQVRFVDVPKVVEYVRRDSEDGDSDYEQRGEDVAVDEDEDSDEDDRENEQEFSDDSDGSVRDVVDPINDFELDDDEVLLKTMGLLTRTMEIRLLAKKKARKIQLPDSWTPMIMVQAQHSILVKSAPHGTRK